MRLSKLSLLVASMWYASSVNAAKLPFETYAFTEIEIGIENNDAGQALNGFGRCMGTMLVISWSDLRSEYEGDNPNSEINLAYKGLAWGALFQQFFYKGLKDEEMTTEKAKAMYAEADEAASYYAEAYLAWLERDGTSVENLDEYHPFMIELDKCMEVGSALNKSRS